MIDRRAFLRASLAVACAPMIVRASSLMALPVRKPLVQEWAQWMTDRLMITYDEMYLDILVYGVHARDENGERVDPMLVFNGLAKPPYIFPGRA